MLFEELLREERAEGREEGREEGKKEGRKEGAALFVVGLLEDVGEVSEELKETILNQKDINILKAWTKIAAKAETVEQFMKEMQN